jgi:hypothetical protein
MEHMLSGVALIVLLPLSAFGQIQTSNAPPPLGPHQVAPKEATKPEHETPEAATIRNKLEGFGYTDIQDLGCDSMGVWHAHALKDNAQVSIAVGKGGRILPQQR